MYGITVSMYCITVPRWTTVYTKCSSQCGLILFFPLFPDHQWDFQEGCTNSKRWEICICVTEMAFSGKNFTRCNNTQNVTLSFYSRFGWIQDQRLERWNQQVAPRKGALGGPDQGARWAWLWGESAVDNMEDPPNRCLRPNRVSKGQLTNCPFCAFSELDQGCSTTKAKKYRETGAINISAPPKTCREWGSCLKKNVRRVPSSSR